MIIKILHLYYDLMNLYGEYGNVKVLEKHLKDQGTEVLIDSKTLGEEIDFSSYDLVYMGAGTEHNLLLALDDLKKYKEDLKSYIEQEKFLLFTGNSYEILGKDIDSKEGLGILNFKVELTPKRNTADIIAKSELFENPIVGFVNNSSSIAENSYPLMNVTFGIGESSKSMCEGIHYKNAICTHLIGPLLSRNPEILEYFVTKLCEQKEPNFKYQKISYEEEQKAYEIVLSELTKRYS